MKRVFLKVVCFVCLVFFAMRTFSWDAVGHIIVAEIAYQHLTPTAKNDIDNLFKRAHFSLNFPAFTPYAYSAPWPDYLDYEIKVPTDNRREIFSYLINSATSWHYIDDPIEVGHLKHVILKPDVDNSVWAVNYLVPKLKGDVSNKRDNFSVYDLIFLTHIVGDIHQPLHNASLYNDQFPMGDVGGNLYRIKPFNNITELHALWDESLGRFLGMPGFCVKAGCRPPQAALEKIAKNFSVLCGAQNDLKPEDWERQSHLIAENFVYPIKNNLAPNPGEALKASYIALGQQVAAKQMCRAGKRLAAVLNAIFKKEG